MNQIFHHWSRVATDSTSWDNAVCTHDTLWRQNYIRTSKEYLINCHILLQYFKLVFLQLQLVQILCKLIIIWVNYEKTKRGPFLWNTMYADGTQLAPCVLCQTRITWWNDFQVMTGKRKSRVTCCSSHSSVHYQLTLQQQPATLQQHLVVVIPTRLHNCCHFLLILSTVFPVQLCCFVVCWTVGVRVVQERLEQYTSFPLKHWRYITYTLNSK